MEVIECTGNIFDNMTIRVQRERGAKLDMNCSVVLKDAVNWRNTTYRYIVVSSRCML